MPVDPRPDSSIEAPLGGWLALRFQGDRKESASHWVWMIPPEMAQPFRRGLGQLARGARDWDNEWLLAICEGLQDGIVAELAPGSERGRFHHMAADRYDASRWNPARRPDGVEDFSWITIRSLGESKRQIPGAGPARTRRWIDQALRREFPELPEPIELPLGPYLRDQSPDGRENYMRALLQPAQAEWEGRQIAQGLAPALAARRRKTL